MHRLGGRYVLWCSSAWWSLTIWIRALPRGCLIPPATVSGHWKGLRELKTPPRSTRLLAFCLAGNIICVWKGFFFVFFFKWKRYIFLKVQKLTGDCFTLEAGHPAYFLLQSWYFFPKKELVDTSQCVANTGTEERNCLFLPPGKAQQLEAIRRAPHCHCHRKRQQPGLFSTDQAFGTWLSAVVCWRHLLWQQQKS